MGVGTVNLMMVLVRSGCEKSVSEKTALEIGWRDLEEEAAMTQYGTKGSGQRRQQMEK